MKRILVISVLIALPFLAFAKGGNDDAPGKEKASGQSAKQYAPGQAKASGESAKSFAPGTENKGQYKSAGKEKYGKPKK